MAERGKSDRVAGIFQHAARRAAGLPRVQGRDVAHSALERGSQIADN